MALRIVNLFRVSSVQLEGYWYLYVAQMCSEFVQIGRRYGKDTDYDIRSWVALTISFNPFSRSSFVSPK